MVINLIFSDSSLFKQITNNGVVVKVSIYKSVVQGSNPIMFRLFIYNLKIHAHTFEISPHSYALKNCQLYRLLKKLKRLQPFSKCIFLLAITF